MTAIQKHNVSYCLFEYRMPILQKKFYLATINKILAPCLKGHMKHIN